MLRVLKLKFKARGLQCEGRPGLRALRTSQAQGAAYWLSPEIRSNDARECALMLTVLPHKAVSLLAVFVLEGRFSLLVSGRVYPV